MRVTFVLPFFSTRPIGGFRVVYEFANGLARRGHEAIVVHARNLPGVPRGNSLRARATRMLDRLSQSRGVVWMEVDRAVRLMNVTNLADASVPAADVIFATSWQTAAPVSRLPEEKGRKHYLVMDFYPYLAPRQLLESSWRSGFQIATISGWLTDMVIAAGVEESKVLTVSCGVSSVHSARLHHEAREMSVVMMYGTANYKASKDGLHAIALARERIGNFPVRLFGPNFSRRPEGLPEWAEYHPRLSEHDVSRLYNQSAIFVSSSVAEGFCLPAAEAMASGCAVVATDSGGIRDFAIHGINALLSEPGSPERLAENILRVSQDSDLRSGLVTQGMATIRNQTWDAAVDRLELFLNRNRKI